MNHEPYPLEWPIGRPRTPDDARVRSRFYGHTQHAKKLHDGTTWTHKSQRPITIREAREGLWRELEHWDATRVVLSTNVQLTMAGEPYSNRREPYDPGAVMYFTRRGRHYSMAADLYDRVADNIRAIAVTLESIRRIERHGGTAIMEQALGGFAALPAAVVARPPWWEVLGLAPDSDLDTAEAAYRARIRTGAHPDTGGDPEAAAELGRALQEAREVLA